MAEKRNTLKLLWRWY